MDYEWMLPLSIKEKNKHSYTTVPLDIIDKLFKKKHDRDLDPPVSWRDSALRIREFRRHARCKQHEIVALEEKRDQQRTQLVAEAEPIVRELEHELQQQELLELQDAAVDIVDGMWERGEMREQQELEELALPIVRDYEQALPCSGIFLKEIIEARRKTETAALTKGFLNLIGNAIGNLGHSISHNLPQIWPDDLAVRGFVLTSVDSNVAQWFCEKVMDETAQMDFESNYLFRHPECTFVRIIDRSTCYACYKSINSLIRRCVSEAGLRDGTIDLRKTPNVRLVMSPGLSLKKMSATSKDLRNAQKQLSRQEQTAADYIQRFGQQVQLRDRKMHVDLFSDDIEELGKKFLDKELIPDDHMARYIFGESCHRARVAARSGKTACKCTPLFLRFAIGIRLQMKAKHYAFLATTFHLPSARTVSDYLSPGAHAPDGILYDVLKMQREEFEKELKNREDPPSENFAEWLHCGSLCFDSKKGKEKVLMDQVTGEIIGYEQDAFELDIILQEIKRLQVPNEEQDSEPKLAQHYLVFIFSTWEKSGHHKQFVVARYAVKTITSRFLKREVRKIIHALFLYEFIVTAISGDGASENRSTFHDLCTHTIADILPTLKEEPNVPTSMKIAFRHPCRKDLLIFVQGDMPHIIKKFVNALERSGDYNSTTWLQFREQYLSLGDLQDIWLECRKATENSIRTEHLSKDHFPPKNANTRMRVHLAAQITSQTMIQLIDKYAPDPDNFVAMKAILGALDRFIDIINAKMENRGIHKGCHIINSPHHPHLTELIEIAKIFGEWKNENAGSSHFIPQSTYEDICWAVFGTVGMAKTYLFVDGKRKMNQAKSGSDPCEHHFGNINDQNANANAGEMRSYSAKSTASRGHTLHHHNKTNSSGKQQGYVTAEVTTEMSRRPREDAVAGTGWAKKAKRSNSI